MDLSPKAVEKRRESVRYKMAYSGKQVTIEVEEYEALQELAAKALEWKNLCVRPGFQTLPESEELVKAIENYEFTMYYMPDQRILDRAHSIPDIYPLVDEETLEPIEELDGLHLNWDQKLYIAAMSIHWRQSISVTLERIIKNALKEYGQKSVVNEVLHAAHA